jgi:hypothetical protein
MYIQFNVKGGFDGIYWDNPNKPTYEENEKTLRESTLKKIKADLVLVVGSENIKTQAHFTHITLPGKTNIDTSPFYLKNEVDVELTNNGFKYFSEKQIYLLQLYNRAITAEDIFISTLLFYQMIEVVIKVASSNKLDEEALNELKMFVSKTDGLRDFSDRILSSLNSITIETSKELLLKGIIELIGEEKSKFLDIGEFKNWRILRGNLTHPTKAKELTEEQFVNVYKTIRKFCTDLIQKFYD